MMVLFSPELADESLNAALDAVREIVANAGGQEIRVKRDQPWGRRRLAYPIQKFRDATYVLYWFAAGPPAIAPIERDLRLDERVIRHLIVRLDEAEIEEEAADPAGKPAEARPEASGEDAEPAETQPEAAGDAEPVEEVAAERASQ